jgi:hypothetical protein
MDDGGHDMVDSVQTNMDREHKADNDLVEEDN